MRPAAASLTLPGLDAGYDEAMDMAGRLLARRDRTVREVRDRLTGAGFEEHTVDLVIARLHELALLDDAKLARDWVEERSTRKGLAPAALAEELRARGVDPAVVAEAVARIEEDDEARAIEVAVALGPRYAHLTPARQAARLQATLARKGYSEEAIGAAIRSVLPPEGWD